MSKIDFLTDWKLNSDVESGTQLVRVTIGLKYPDPLQFIPLEPKERISQINLTYKENLKRLIALGLFHKYEVTGAKRRPTGVKTTVHYNSLSILEQLDFIGGVTIGLVEGAVLRKPRVLSKPKYFCVKMTVIIEIEGVLAKTESVEDRSVLIRAKSTEGAYEQLEKQKDRYAVTYLNSDGRFVRWRIESFDDCYEVELFDKKGFNSSEGVEVYSKLRSRKTRRSIAWDGR